MSIGKHATRWATLLLLLAPVAAPAVSQEEANDQQEKAEKKENGKKKEPQDETSVTKHRVSVGGQEIAYTATAGTLVMKKEDGSPLASIFYIAYTRDGVRDPATRPITFSFNGGPGSSSVWLHLGVLGPRRVDMPDEPQIPRPPYRLVDNAESILDVTDLVFIDPVTTGYSRAVPPEKDDPFHGFEQDIESVGDFIRLHLTRSERWASPKFLIGESYGTTRAAGLSGYLQDRHGIYLNGVMLVSSILNFQTARFEVGNDLPHVLFLPTYTATAWYHRRLPADLQSLPLRQVLDAAEAFASGDYSLALARQAEMPEAEVRAVAQDLARFTGLSLDYVLRSNLRVPASRFFKELQRDAVLTTGRLDSRYTGVDRDAAGERNEFDPSYAAIQGPYTATLNDYVRRTLGFKSDLPYEILTGRVGPWSYEEYQNRYLNVAETLRQAMAKNPWLQVYVANGYYDLATPYYATEYTFDTLQLAPSLADNVTMGYFEAGHMMYIHGPSRRAMKEDLTEFIQTASGAGSSPEP
ncbi:MAG: S10 family peptidase [Thermoanaerobaculia bacterium]